MNFHRKSNSKKETHRVKHHAKASSAGSTQGSGNSRGLLRRALAPRGGFGAGEGTGAPAGGGVGARTHTLRIGALTALAFALFLAMSASSASAALPASFGTEGSGAGQIQGEAQGIAVDQESGDVYVADTGNARIDKFTSEGQFILAFGWGVADGSPELQVCTTTCQAGIHGAGAGQFESAEGIAVDNSGGPSDGDVYVVDHGNVRVEKFSAVGQFLLAFGEEGPGPGQFEPLVERSVAVGPTGTVYVGDRNRVQKFSEAGALEGEVALPGTGRTQNLAVDSAGDIYRQSGELEGIHKYDPAGTELGAPRATVGSELPITVESAHNLYVGTAGRVLGFDAEGAQITSFAALGVAAISYNEVTEAFYKTVSGGKVAIVTPPPPGPLVISESATELGPTTATLNATLNPEGGEPTHYFFEYGIEAGVYGQTSPIPPAETTGGPFEDQPVSSAISGLQTRTTYHYRLSAESECEPLANPGHVCVTEGPDQTFTTLPPVSIDATLATSVSATAATLAAELNPHGRATTYHFEYDTTPYAEGEGPHGTSTPTASAGSGGLDVLRSAQIQGLQPLTTYHYRVVAENSLGTSVGPDRTFATQSPFASALLPDGRGWEMVTPPNKHGAAIQPLTENGGLIQASAHCDPESCSFASVAPAPLGPESQGSRSTQVSQLLSARGPAGWSTTDITTPHQEISEIRVGFPSEYTFFSEDLSSGLVEPEGITPLSSQTTERTPYRREADGTFVPLVTASNVLAGVKFGGEEFPSGSGTRIHGVEFRAASPDAAHVVLSSPQILTETGFRPGFEINPDPEQRISNLYELSGGQFTLLSVLPDGEAALEAAVHAGVGSNNINMRGAVSADGSRVFFEASKEGNRHLYLRANALAPQSASGACDEPGRACTIQLDLPQGGPGGPGAVTFQAASADGSRVFFTDDSRLTPNSTAAPNQPDLYMCQIEASGGELSCALTDLSVDPNVGEAGNVQGIVSAVDVSGAHVYFAADGVLTTEPDSHGEVARPGNCQSAGEADCNLYLYDTETEEVSLVAVLSSHDDPVWAGRTNLLVLVNLTARSSPDGRFFTFMSTRSLTGYDNRDARSGARDAEVYLYDSTTGHLSCASCNPTGARPHGVFDPPREFLPHLRVDQPSSWRERWLAASIPGWTSQSLEIALRQPRYLDDSGRLFFNSADALVPADTNGVMDVYEFEPPNVGSCTDASATYSPTSGGCVSLISSGTSEEESAFLDASESGDDVFFLTVSRVAPKDVDSAFDVYDASVGGGEPEQVNPPECAGDACQQPAVPPNDATPGSLTFNGAGNVVECPKGKVKQNGKCVKKHKANKHKKAKKKNSNKKKSKSSSKGKKQKRANSKHGGHK